MRQGFGTIRNNTALKRDLSVTRDPSGFGTIRNNTALKLLTWQAIISIGFGTIRNNTALKPDCERCSKTLFWNHSSKT